MTDARVRLLKFVALFACGGTERQFVNLGLALNPERFDLRFGCTHPWGHFLKEVQEREIPVTSYPIGSFASARCLSQQLRLAHHLAQQDIQIVQGYSFYGNVFALPAARLAGTPVVIASVRDQGAYLTPRQKMVQRLVCRMADCVLVNADAIREWLIADGFEPEKIVVIPNGIDVGRFHASADAEGPRRELGIAPDAPVVTMVSRLSPTKGVEDLLEAIAAAAVTHPTLRALIVGEGLVAQDGVVKQDRAYLDSLIARAKRLGITDRVIFTGYRSDIPALLAQSTVFVLPSLTEGLSNVVLEAMAAGLPVIATRVGGTPEIIREGQNGLLVPPSDPVALRTAITTVLDNPALAKGLGDAARRSVEDRFSMARMVNATEALYTDLLARKQRIGRRAASRVLRLPGALLAGRRS